MCVCELCVCVCVCVCVSAGVSGGGRGGGGGGGGQGVDGVSWILDNRVPLNPVPGGVCCHANYIAVILRA